MLVVEVLMLTAAREPGEPAPCGRLCRKLGDPPGVGYCIAGLATP